MSRQVIRLAADAMVDARRWSDTTAPADSRSSSLNRRMDTEDIASCSAALERWREDHMHATWSDRTRIGSLAVWNATRIILRYGLLGVAVEDVWVQSAAVDILDLCIEAGDKIELLNWVSGSKAAPACSCQSHW